MTQLSVFSFNQNEVRTVISDDGEIWFVASDVCTALGLDNTTKALLRLDEDEATLTTIQGRTPTGGLIEKPANVINESGLYSLVLTSRKPEAKQFKKWVTSEVLPSIRKNGGYIAGQENDDPELIIAKALQVAQNVIDRKSKELEQVNAKVEVLEPKAKALDVIANTTHTYTIRECAKTIGIREKDLVALLLKKKWCYRDNDKKLQPHADKCNQGIFKNRPSPVIRNQYDGQERIFLHMRVTAFGLTRITGLVNKERCKAA